VCEQTGLGPGSVVEVFHRVARLWAGLPDRLIQEYRQAPVKHADETGWRTKGKNGDAWLFATPQLSLFLFRQTRAASVPQQVFGKPWLPGCLVVDRYGGYNKVPCAIQYCYSHLLREVQDLEREFPEAAEVTAFVSTVAPQLALAMGLRAQPISDAEFARQAVALKAQIIASMDAPSHHLGIRRIQEIFRAHVDRLDHWADDRRVPAENNLAERDLRPTVIARKVSFGSQSDAGAHTRGLLMSVLHTLKKRGYDVVAHLKGVLDQLADDIHQDPWPLLFPEAPT
jgi:transposase